MSGAWQLPPAPCDSSIVALTLSGMCIQPVMPGVSNRSSVVMYATLTHTMVSLGDIQAARERIRGAIRQTPVLFSEVLSREAGNQLFLKLENLNVTGSYKERGALNRILTLTAEERARGVITASAGNHAQAVAYHASQRGIR